MISPLIFTEMFGLLELIVLLLFPIAIVTSITLASVLIYIGIFIFAFKAFFTYRDKIANFLSFNKKENFFFYINLGFLIYIASFSFSRLINTGVQNSLHSLLRTSQDYFIFLWPLLFAITSKKNKNILKYSILLAGIVSVSYGLLQFLGFDFFNRQTDLLRLSGFHKNPYSYGGQLIIFFFFFLYYIFEENKNYNSFLKLLFVVLTLFCIFNTSQRAVIFGVLLGLSYYLIFNKPGIKYALKSMAIISSVFLIAVYFNKSILERIKSVFVRRRGARANPRLKIWKIAIGLWKKNIFFGVGKFTRIYYQFSEGFAPQLLTHAHNVYIQILVVNGILGLFGFINLFLSIVRTFFGNICSGESIIWRNCVLSVILSFLVEGIFEFFWGDSEVRYLLLYFLGFALANFFEVSRDRSNEL